MPKVLDSSAVLAVIFAEPGAARVVSVLEDSIISSVNVAEVLRIAVRKGADSAQARRSFARLRLPIIPFDDEDATETAAVASLAPHLSLGDCACIALARRQSAQEVLTAERAWTGIDFGIRVTLIR